MAVVVAVVLKAEVGGEPAIACSASVGGMVVNLFVLFFLFLFFFVVVVVVRRPPSSAVLRLESGVGQPVRSPSSLVHRRHGRRPGHCRHCCSCRRKGRGREFA